MTIAMPSSAQYQTTSYIYPAGFDGGNSDTCFSTTDQYGQETTIVIPSAIEEGSAGNLELFRSAMHASNEPRTGYKQDIQIDYSGNTYFVGDLAYRQRALASTQKGDQTRYGSTTQLVRLLATSALAIHDRDYEINLVTTMPVDYYSQAMRITIRDAFKGVHRFSLNGAERQATIHVKKVMMEGPPAMSIYGEHSETKKRIIIDGGGYTTEFLLLDGNDPVADRCRGVEIGVENVAEYLFDQVRQLHNRKLKQQECHDILRAYGSQATAQPETYPDIRNGAYQISHAELASIVKVGCQKIGEKTLNIAASLWGVTGNVVAGDIAHQYHIGGSVLFYGDTLRTRMPNLIPVARAEQANARGCAFIAEALTGR